MYSKDGGIGRGSDFITATGNHGYLRRSERNSLL